MIIKETPEDFRVDEVLDLEIKNKGDYAYFILEKKAWTTLKAISSIAKILRVSEKRFSFAGQKDRQGITRQYVSAYQISVRSLYHIKLKDIKIEFLGYGDRPITLGQLEGNKFEIVVRELKRPLTIVHAIPNYYDDQRFGGFRPNMHLAGKQVLLGNYEEAVKIKLLNPFPCETPDYVEARESMKEHWGDWRKIRLPNSMTIEKRIVGHLVNHPKDFKGALKALPRQLFTMLTHAYQGYIFNRSLSEYLKRNNQGFREVNYSLGKLIFVNKYFKKDWPIVGYNSKLEGQEKEIIENIMKEEGIWYDTFRCPISALSSEGLTRRAMVKVTDFKASYLDKRKGVQDVSFFLPKGSYATIVIKAMQL